MRSQNLCKSHGQMVAAMPELICLLNLSVAGEEHYFLVESGVRHVDKDTVLDFQLVNSETAPEIDPAYWLPSGANLTTQIANPFGMEGVVLNDLSLSATKTLKTSGGGGSATKPFNLAVGGAVQIGDDAKLKLRAALLVNNSKAILAVLQIDANPPLPLSDVLTHCFGVSTDNFLSKAAGNFAFSGGQILRWKGPPTPEQKNPKKTKPLQKLPIDPKTVESLLKQEKITIYQPDENNTPLDAIQSWQPGYYLNSKFLLFGHELDAALSLVDGKTDKSDIHMSATIKALDFGFAKIDALTVELDINHLKNGKKIDTKRHLKVMADIEIISSRLQFQAEYYPDRKAFAVSTGQLKKPLDFIRNLVFTWEDKHLTGEISAQVDVPLADTNVHCTVGFQYTKHHKEVDSFVPMGPTAKPGFHITHVDGVPSFKALDWAETLAKAFSPPSGKCAKVLGDWLKCKIHFTPTRNPDGKITYNKNTKKLKLPIKLEYVIDIPIGDDIKGHVDFNLFVTLPEGGLKDLPNAIIQSALDTDNAPRIATAMLSQEDTYKALAALAMAKGGADAAAGFVCRFLKKALEKLKEAAQKLADALDSIASIFEKLIEAAEKAFLGQAVDGLRKKEHRKKEKRAKELIALMVPILEEIDHRMDDLRARIMPVDPMFEWDSDGNLASHWTTQNILTHGKKEATNFELFLQKGREKPGATLRKVECIEAQVVVPWSSIPEHDKFHGDANVRGVMHGVTFMDKVAKDAMAEQADTFDGMGVPSAQKFAEELRARIKTFEDYKKIGVFSKAVKVNWQGGQDLILDQNRLGMNSVLG